MVLRLPLESPLPNHHSIHESIPSHRVSKKRLKRFENWDIPTVASSRDSL